MSFCEFLYCLAGYNPVAEPSARYWVILFNFGLESTFIFH
jgi:hypothetical protein